FLSFHGKCLSLHHRKISGQIWLLATTSKNAKTALCRRLGFSSVNDGMRSRNAGRGFHRFSCLPVVAGQECDWFLEVTSSPAPAVAGDVRGWMENVEAAVSPFI
ncbi:MAG: hypothetical protein K2I12_06260, partial [Duncaniella sp.]|nr:hypothetical protein [Duncaniella sp.]